MKNILFTTLLLIGTLLTTSMLNQKTINNLQERQGKNELFAETETKFFLKVVVAQIEFSKTM